MVKFSGLSYSSAKLGGLSAELDHCNARTILFVSAAYLRIHDIVI